MARRNKRADNLVVSKQLIISGTGRGQRGRRGGAAPLVRYGGMLVPSVSLDIAFDFAIAACLVAALASLLRGRRYVHEEHGTASAGDDLEGGQSGVLRVGDPAAVRGHLAQRR